MDNTTKILLVAIGVGAIYLNRKAKNTHKYRFEYAIKDADYVIEYYDSFQQADSQFNKRKRKDTVVILYERIGQSEKWKCLKKKVRDSKITYKE